MTVIQYHHQKCLQLFNIHTSGHLYHHLYLNIVTTRSYNISLFDTMGLVFSITCVPVPLLMVIEERIPDASLNVGTLLSPNGSCGDSLCLGGGGLISLDLLRSWKRKMDAK